jgi:hypothetical protein
MAKRTKPPRAERSEDHPSSAEDERELERLLRLIRGRGSAADWESVGKEDRQQRG